MQLGCFSVSLAVKDLAVSRAFYEKLGFTVFAGDPAMNYLIMQNGTTNIGLFQGMFEQNILTFNPGWTQTAESLDDFTDVRDIQAALKNAGATVVDQEVAQDGKIITSRNPGDIPAFSKALIEMLGETVEQDQLEAA